MKTLQQNTGLDHDHRSGDPTEKCCTDIWDNKSAADVLREQYHDRCVIKKVSQPKPIRTGVSRPDTYIVYDRSRTINREDDGRAVGTLVELP